MIQLSIVSPEAYRSVSSEQVLSASSYRCSNNLTPEIFIAANGIRLNATSDPIPFVETDTKPKRRRNAITEMRRKKAKTEIHGGESGRRYQKLFPGCEANDRDFSLRSTSAPLSKLFQKGYISDTSTHVVFIELATRRELLFNRHAIPVSNMNMYREIKIGR